MGTLNWIAVLAAWLAAASVGFGFYGWRAFPSKKPFLYALAALLLFVSATMIGHMFARVGEHTLDAKPWLYFMMTGGIALTFVGPAILITSVRREGRIAEAGFDWLGWVIAYLAMGTVFWLLA